MDEESQVLGVAVSPGMAIAPTSSEPASTQPSHRLLVLVNPGLLERMICIGAATAIVD